ncbi:MAG: hypothetical protein ABR913_03900 [Sedimentisphaerales bacterium]|jgi:hypothetical protein
MSPKIKLAGITLLILFAVTSIAVAVPYSPYEASRQSYAHNSAVVTIDNNATGTNLEDINGLSAKVLAGKIYAIKADLFVVEANDSNGSSFSLGGGTWDGEILREQAYSFPVDEAGYKWVILTAVISVDKPGTINLRFCQKIASGVNTVKSGSYLKLELLN